MSNYCGLLCILCFVNIHFANTLFDRSLFNSLTEVENAHIIHKVTHVSRKRSVIQDSVPSAIQTSVKSDQHDVTLTFKQSERHWLSPLLYANSRKAFYKPCISAYEDVANNAHAIVDSCNNQNNLQMLAEVLIDNEVYVILPNQSLPSDTQHGFFRVQPLPYNLTNDYIEPDNTDIPVPPKASRFRRQTDPNIVELVFVIDPSMYKFWYDVTTGTDAVRQSTTDEYIQKYYTFLANGMNARYSSLTTYDLNIGVELVGIYVAKTQGDMILTATADYTDSTRGVITGEDLLASFKTWVAEQKAINNLNFPPNADHYMLMTGHDITLNGVIESAGYAYLGKICTSDAVSLVDLRFDLLSGTVAAHELGHSLGGRHDGVIDGCSDADGYVLASSNSAQTVESKKRNPWIFSNCSATLFKEKVATLSLNGAESCLLTNNESNELAATGAGPGQTFSPDRQCEIIVGKKGSEMKRSVHHGKYEEICTGMWCTDGDIQTVTLVIPAEGTTCGNNKWCSDGQCVSSTDAPAGDETCLFGDQPGEYSLNQLCASVVAENKANCYQEKIAASCCTSCAQAKVWDVAGCEYGDLSDCSKVSSAQCYGSYISKVQCCKTCKDYEKPNLPADCLYGNHFTNCLTSHCTNLPIQCCESCYIAATTKEATTTQGTGSTITRQTAQTTRQQETTRTNAVFTTQASTKSELPGWIIPTIATVGGIVFIGLLIALVTYFCNEQRKNGRHSRPSRRSNSFRGHGREYDYDPKEGFSFPNRFNRH